MRPLRDATTMTDMVEPVEQPHRRRVERRRSSSGRRREPTVAVTVRLPRSLLQRAQAEIKGQESLSTFIRDALRDRLDGRDRGTRRGTRRRRRLGNGSRLGNHKVNTYA